MTPSYCNTFEKAGINIVEPAKPLYQFMEPIRYIGDVQRLELKPGDTIVLNVDYLVSDVQRENILSSLDCMFEGKHKVLLLEKGMKIGVMGNGEASTAED